MIQAAFLGKGRWRAGNGASIRWNPAVERFNLSALVVCATLLAIGPAIIELQMRIISLGSRTEKRVS
jgi:hypothetical protein